MSSNIFFVRHAESFGNKSGMIGYTDENDKLTPYGIEQAQHLGKRLRRIIHATRLPVYVYVSEANRTLETAFHSGILSYGTEFIIDPRLNEISMGELLNIPREQRRELFERVLTGVEERFPSGEGVHHVTHRGSEFVSTRTNRAIHLAFTHGIWIESVTGRKKPKNASITPYLNIPYEL